MCSFHKTSELIKSIYYDLGVQANVSYAGYSLEYRMNEFNGTDSHYPRIDTVISNKVLIDVFKIILIMSIIFYNVFIIKKKGSEAFSEIMTGSKTTFSKVRSQNSERRIVDYICDTIVTITSWTTDYIKIFVQLVECLNKYLLIIQLIINITAPSLYPQITETAIKLLTMTIVHVLQQWLGDNFTRAWQDLQQWLDALQGLEQWLGADFTRCLRQWLGDHFTRALQCLQPWLGADVTRALLQVVNSHFLCSSG
jgi:hypothetical protein